MGDAQPLGVRRSCLAAVFVGCLFAGCCVLGLASQLLIDALATDDLRNRLREHGIECDERFALDVRWDGAAATLAPTRCTLAEGGIEWIEALDPVEIDLGSGFEPERVRAGRSRLALRFDPPVLRASGWGVLLETLAIPQRLGLLVQGAAQIAARRPPPTDIRSVEVVREAETVASLGVVRLDRAEGEATRIDVDRVDLPALRGPLGVRAEIAVEPLRAVATRARVELEGELDVDASAPVIGAVRQRMHVGIVAEGLEGGAPRWQVRL